MARKGDPGALAHVVIFLRSRTGLTQAQFGREVRVDQADVSRYELGKLAPPEAILRRMADAAGIGWPLVAHLRQFLTSLLRVADQGAHVSAEAPLDVTILEPALLAAAPYLLELAAIEPE